MMQAAPAFSDLVAYFSQGCKPLSECYMGVEWEKIGVYRETGRAIGYGGPSGVEAIFTALIERYGWEPDLSFPPIIALKKSGSSITLEPGGQIELSGQKARRLVDNAHELQGHLDEIQAVSQPLGIAWLGIGAQPFSTAEEIEWVPKERYKIMRESLKGRGELTFSMMKETASVQASFDYHGERDALEKLRLAMGLSPFLTAMFANSPLHRGRPSGFLSRRAEIWEKTAPERSGIVWDRIAPEKGFAGYAEFALDVPMLFLQRDKKWVPVRGITFRQFLEKGYEGICPTIDDWKLHLSGIFTEARLKQIVEVRSIDCQKSPMGLAAAALLKGLFYHEPSRKKALDMVSAPGEEGLRRLRREAAIKGLAAPMADGRKIIEACRRLFAWAEEGLGDEKDYLAPLKTNLEKEKTPAEIILACFDARKPILSCVAIEG